MTDLKLYRGTDEVVHCSEIIQDLSKDDFGQKIYSGITVLDEMLNFFSLGEIVVLSGPPGHGKTSFAKYLLSKFSQAYKCLYFGKEGMNRQFFEKFPSTPDFYMSREFIKNSIDWMEQRIIEGQEKYGCRIIFIDHLHYILDMSKLGKENTSIFIGAFMRNLVEITKKHNILVFLLAHTNKEVFSRAPNLSDIRDSSFIVQEADVVMFIWRLQKMIGEFQEIEFVDNDCKVSIQKNRRHGILKTILMKYDKGNFYEKDTTIG